MRHRLWPIGQLALIHLIFTVSCRCAPHLLMNEHHTDQEHPTFLQNDWRQQVQQHQSYEMNARNNLDHQNLHAPEQQSLNPSHEVHLHETHQSYTTQPPGLVNLNNNNNHLINTQNSTSMQNIVPINQQQQPMIVMQSQYQPVTQQQQQQVPTPVPMTPQQQQAIAMSNHQLQMQIQSQAAQHQQLTGYRYQPSIVSPLYLGHNPFIEILRPLSYADDNIVTLNLSHSHIYEIDSDAFVGQRFEHIDLSNNKLGLIHSRSFRIGPLHSRHTPFELARQSSSSSSSSSANQGSQHAGMLLTGNISINNLTQSSNNKYNQQQYATRRPPPAHPKSVTIDLSHNPAIVALSGAFDHIDVPNCLLNFTNSTVELKFGAFKKYFKEHPGHLVDIDTVDCCEQEWLLGYRHNFVARTHCVHDPSLYLLKASQQTIIDSCIAYVKAARHSMILPSSGIIHTAAANGPRHSANSPTDNQQLYLTHLILGGTAMILTSLSIYIIFYMFSLKAAFVIQMQTQKN